MKIIIRRKGGPGSGNWGHSGRPGVVGGSSPGGGRGVSIKTSASLRTPIVSGKPQECYENARMEYHAQIAAGNKATYMLGILEYRRSPVQIQHAWVQLEDGSISDPTPIWKDGNIGGVAIPAEAVGDARVYVGRAVSARVLTSSLRTGNRAVRKPETYANFWNELYASPEFQNRRTYLNSAN